MVKRSPFFYGVAAENDYVLNPLVKIPTTDTNKNFAFDADETASTKNVGKLRQRWRR
ncbi:MAG: hypothetical protein ACI935_003350 [Moritella dasanensis]